MSLMILVFTFFTLLDASTGTDAESARYRCEYGDDEVDDCFPGFLFHNDVFLKC